jgi:hypothetical protein
MMKSRMIPLAGILLTMACAHDIAPPTRSDTVALPQLKGTWEGEYRAHFEQRTRNSRMRLIIAEQDGEFFRGLYEWEDFNEQPTGQERIIGIIGFNGRVIHIAEETDTGRFDAEMIGPDRMRAVYVESGANAGVFRVELARTNR